MLKMSLCPILYFVNVNIICPLSDYLINNVIASIPVDFGLVSLILEVQFGDPSFSYIQRKIIEVMEPAAEKLQQQNVLINSYKVVLYILLSTALQWLSSRLH